MAFTKAHILDEIRRTAEQNGGAPLGIPRFAKKTGIEAHHWRGIHWARWSEAVREAGFEPNKLNEAFDEQHLICKFVELASELGRLPSESDLQLKRTRDPSFPYKRAFRNLGSKDERLAKVIQYCGESARFKTVATRCYEQLRALRVSAPSDDNSKASPGYVYLMKHGSRREYRIGCTDNALRREGEIGIELPEKVQPVHVIKTDDRFGVEAYWHRRFEAKRKNGDCSNSVRLMSARSKDGGAFRKRRKRNTHQSPAGNYMG